MAKSLATTIIDAARNAIVGLITRSMGQAAKSNIRAVGELGGVIKTGGRNALENGRAVITGVGRGFSSGARSIDDLGRRLARQFKFRKFKFSIRGRNWRLLGKMNPWILMANGDIRRVDADSLNTSGKPRKGDTVTYTDEAGNVFDDVRVITPNDTLPKNSYKTIYELFYGTSPKGQVIHHMIEQQMRHFDGITEEFLNNANRLKAFPSGVRNSAVHLSSKGIRGMWNDFYKIVLPMIESGDISPARYIQMLENYSSYTDEFIEHTLSNVNSNTSREAIDRIMEQWTRSNPRGNAIKNALNAGGE